MADTKRSIDETRTSLASAAGGVTIFEAADNAEMLADLAAIVPVLSRLQGWTSQAQNFYTESQTSFTGLFRWMSDIGTQAEKYANASNGITEEPTLATAPSVVSTIAAWADTTSAAGAALCEQWDEDLETWGGKDKPHLQIHTLLRDLLGNKVFALVAIQLICGQAAREIQDLAR